MTVRSDAGRDRGSGTVLLLGVIAVATVLAAGLALLVSAQLARGRAQAAADLAALAAADRLRSEGAGLVGIGAPELAPSGAVAGAADPCADAAVVAERNGTRLVSCRVEAAGVVRVAVTVRARAGTASAQARAGPVGAAQG